MIDASEYQRLKRRAEGLRRKADQAAGAEAELRKRLKREFGCASLEDARALLERMKKELAGLEAEYAKAMAAFERDWAGKLGG